MFCTYPIWLAFEFGDENTNPDLGILIGILLLRSKIQDQENAHQPLQMDSTDQSYDMFTT